MQKQHTTLEQKRADDESGQPAANLFTFATSELSQDALLCYLVACASKGTGGLQECGKDFVRLLFRAGAEADSTAVPVVVPRRSANADGIPRRHIYRGEIELNSVCEPQRQTDKVDVYFQATIDDKRVAFLIEDKVHSGEHGNQLERYREAVGNDEEIEDFIKPIYLKTGYLFDDERESAQSQHYSVVTALDLLAFFEKQGADRKDEILRQYEERLRQLVRDRKQALNDWYKNKNMDKAHVQWEFMRRLRDLIPIPSELEPSDWTWRGLGRHQNRGGTAWTQYWFNNHHGLFWRIDAGKPLLRLMRKDESGQRNKEEINRRYKPTFLRVLEDIGGLQRGDARTTLGKQTAVGAIKFPECRTEMDDFLERVVCFHRRFLQQIEHSD